MTSAIEQAFAQICTETSRYVFSQTLQIVPKLAASLLELIDECWARASR